MGKDTGGPAFPFEYHNQTNSSQRSFFTDNLVSPNGSEQYAGMTLRDFLAASALQGWLSSYSENEAHPAANGNEHTVAINAYKMADAMLKVRGE